MKFFPSIFLLLALTSLGSVFAQIQTIRGIITDKNTNAALPGASVIIINSSPLKGTVTDENGKFRLEKVPVGRVGIKASYIGYNEVAMNDLELNSGKELILNIEMEEKVVNHKEVVITGVSDKSGTQNQMTTVSSRSFTVEETQRYAGSRNDVARMASSFAGVRGSDDSRNDIIVRGNSPSGLLWRLEGVDIPNPNHYAGFGTTGGPVCMLNNNLMSNSDFLTGAFPAEYGNAISGVFDLKMRNGNNEKHEFLGQIGFNGFELGAEGPISRSAGSSYLINFRYSTLEVMQKLGVDFGTGTGIPKYKDASFKLNFPKTKIGSFSWWGLGGKSDIQMLASKEDTTKNTQTLYQDGLEDLTNGADMAVSGITHSYLINNSSYIKTIISASYHDFITSIDSLTRQTWKLHPYYRNNFRENKLFGSFYYNKKINSHLNFKAGFMVSEMYFNIVDSIYYRIADKFITLHNYKGNTYLIQPNTQWQYKLTDNLVFNMGLHFMFYGLNNTYNLEPRAGIKWLFTPKQSISFAYGRHSMINPITVYLQKSYNSDSTETLIQNKNLDLIHSRHLILGYDWEITERLRLKAEVYYQLIDNAGIDAGADNSFSILNQGANFGVWTPDHLKNTGTGRNYGVELTVEKFLSKGFYYLATGSVYDSRYKGSDGVERNTVFNGSYTFNLLIGKEFLLSRKTEDSKKQHKLAVDFKMTRAGGQRFTPLNLEQSILTQQAVYIDEEAYSGQFPDYWRSDLKIAFKINGRKITQEIALDCTNIFNQKNVLSQTFNRSKGEMDNIYQLSRMIIPQWRITF